MENVNQIKISYGAQIRRFTFIGTEFTSLKRQIAEMFSITDEFVLKYTDDEKDSVILDSQEDLNTALVVSSGLLRLVIDTTIRPKPVSQTNAGSSVPAQAGSSVPVPAGSLSAPPRNRKDPQKKLEKIKKALAEFGDDTTLTPVQSMRKQRLLRKQEKITAAMSGVSYSRKDRNRPRRNERLSPETLQRINGLKQQMQALQGENRQLKCNIRDFKRQEKGQADETIRQEIINKMKERKETLRDQILTLRVAIRSLKEGSNK